MQKHLAMQKHSKRPVTLAIAGIPLLLCCAIGAGGGPTTQPMGGRPGETPASRKSATQPSASLKPPSAPSLIPARSSSVSSTVQELIHQLGDADPRVRDVAGKSLWAVGHAAMPALRQAAGDDSPEIARRARIILRDFAYGLYPGAPRELFSLLEQYRSGGPREKQLAAQRLTSMDIPGIRLLLKLREEERDPAQRRMVTQLLGTREHQALCRMVADGQTDEVEEILDGAASDSASSTRDYAALLSLEGKLPQKLSEPRIRQNPLLFAVIARAAGDLPTARTAAEALPESAENIELLDAILVDQGDWKTLASRRAARRGGRSSRPERFGYLCAYYRLAGYSDAFNRYVRDLVFEGRQVPNEARLCAENLFLNGKPDEGVSVLLKHKDYLQASNYLAVRLRIKEALELPKLAKKDQPGNAIAVQLRTISTLQFIGQTARATKLMTEIAAENRLGNDFLTWVSLVGAAGDLGLPRQAEDYAIAALTSASGKDPLGLLFEKLRLGDGSAAALWWQCLRHGPGPRSISDLLRQLQLIYNQTLSAEDWAKLSESAFRYTARIPLSRREAFRKTVAATLTDAGQPELAAQWIHQLESDPGPTGQPQYAQALIDAGDFRAARKDWPAAAADYDRAWISDHAHPAALFLKGWALAQRGLEKEGKAMMQLADRIPLGDANERFALMRAMAHHHLVAELNRELDLIIQATAPRSWYRDDAMRRKAALLGAKGDDLAASSWLERSLLRNLSDDTGFIEPWADVMMPALVHRSRALGLIHAGQIEAGIAEAGKCLEETPSNADAMIDVVNALEKSGHRARAEAFYQKQTAIYRKLIADYPDSGPAHNQLAWAQVMCHRELDDALKNARRAVELEPAGTASRDTLAEVYFARGDTESAVGQIKKCIEIEPRVKRHRKQLARFQAATHPTTQPRIKSNEHS